MPDSGRSSAAASAFADAPTRSQNPPRIFTSDQNPATEVRGGMAEPGARVPGFASVSSEGPSHDHDELDIPAFLRRGSN